MLIAVVDTETTGTLEQHELWELGVVLVDTEDTAADPRPLWLQSKPERLQDADPRALEVGRYYERTGGLLRDEPSRQRHGIASPSLSPEALAAVVANALAGVRFASCNVTFDTRFVAKWLRRWGQAASWHYSPIDVKSLCYGARPETLGAKTDELLATFRVDVGQCLAWFDLAGDGRHSALGDAYLAVALLYEAMGWGTLYGSRCNDHYGGYRCQRPYGHEGPPHVDRDQRWVRDEDGAIARAIPEAV